jgi:hypothetical protein
LAPKALHHGVAPAPVAASTTMVPVICGRKEQKYSLVPGVVNVKVNLSSVSSGLDLNCLASGLDLVLTPPPLPGSSVIDFDRHKEVFEAAYRWCNGQIARLTQNAIQLSKPFLGPTTDDITRERVELIGDFV